MLRAWPVANGVLYVFPKGNRCQLFDSTPTGSPALRSVLKRPDRSRELSPPGNAKRRKSALRASAGAAASPEEPREVGVPGERRCFRFSHLHGLFAELASASRSLKCVWNPSWRVGWWRLSSLSQEIPASVMVLASVDFSGSWSDKWFFSCICIFWVLAGLL